MNNFIKVLTLAIACTSISSCDLLEDEDEFSFELQFRNTFHSCFYTEVEYSLIMENDERLFILEPEEWRTELVTIKRTDFIRIKIFDVDDNGALLASANIPTDGYSTEDITPLIVFYTGCRETGILTWIAA